MRNFISLLIPLTSVILAGCGSVQLAHPIGVPIAEEAEEIRERFDGTWANEDGKTLHLKYLDGGKLRIANLDWDDEKKSFQKQESTALLTTNQSADYINYRDEDADDPKYAFVRYTFSSDRTMIIWTPNVKAFEKAVTAGKLMGTVKKGENSTSVAITSSPEEVDAFIDPSRFPEQFDVETPVILKRLRE